MKLVALKRLRHPRGPDGKEYAPGDSFEASERDAKAYVLVRAAKDAPQDAEKPRRGRPPKERAVSTNAMTTEGASGLVHDDGPRYARRDMRPED